MIAIIDYGAGNLFSVHNALTYLGLPHEITRDPARIQKADGLILPGVGAFPDAMGMLREAGLLPVIREEAVKKPFLGICLGMQLLFDKSYEYGEHRGLGLIKGSVKPIADAVDKDLKIPHIGWNSLIFPKDREKSPLYKYTGEGDFVYFVNSFYAADCDESVTALTEYGAMLTASVQNKNVYGAQFHPEKSGNVGLGILKAFCEI